MIKQIFILNGKPCSGKDTFAKLLNEHCPTSHISSITPVKEIARLLGFGEEKTLEYRKFLSEQKKILNEHGSFIWDYLDKEVEKFKADSKTQILLIDIREPEEIKKAVRRYNAKTILIERSNIRSVQISNLSDKNVNDYEYDYKIINSGDMYEYMSVVKQFADNIKLKTESVKSEKENEWANKVIAVDFDNTIAKTDYSKILEPIQTTIDFLQNAKENGAEIILYTCRQGKYLQEAVDWCKTHNVPIDRVNENSPARIKQWGNDCRKIGADLYIDDKATPFALSLNSALEMFDSFVNKFLGN